MSATLVSWARSKVTQSCTVTFGLVGACGALARRLESGLGPRPTWGRLALGGLSTPAQRTGSIGGRTAPGAETKRWQAESITHHRGRCSFKQKSIEKTLRLHMSSESACRPIRFIYSCITLAVWCVKRRAPLHSLGDNCSYGAWWRRRAGRLAGRRSVTNLYSAPASSTIIVAGL